MTVHQSYKNICSIQLFLKSSIKLIWLRPKTNEYSNSGSREDIKHVRWRITVIHVITSKICNGRYYSESFPIFIIEMKYRRL